MAFSVTASPAPQAEINITPLVDVMLVLLVIFMVTAPMLSRPLPVALPQHKSLPLDDKPRQLDLQITGDGSYRLDGQMVDSRELASRLQEAVVDDPRAQLRVASAGEADYQQLITALVLVRAAGLEQIRMLGD